jgi:hypothetical protein
MLTARNEFTRYFLSIGFAAFLFMSMFGVFHSAMSMGMDGKMSDCPFMPGMNVCPMSPLEHVSLMQGVFSNIPQQQDATLTLILFITFVAITGFIWFRQLFVPPDRFRAKGYFYRNRHFSIPRLLQGLFSTGILNPKPF